MKKHLCSLFLIFSFMGYSQNFTGQATYKSATSFSFKMDSSKVAADQQAMFKQMMAKALQKEFTLSFNRTESIYKEVETLDKGQGMRMGGMLSMFGGGGGTLYKNISSTQMLEQIEFFGKLFLISDSLHQYQWELHKETKSIGNYTCHKATAQKVNKRIRIETSDAEAKDTIFSDTVQLTAWYTMQIPVSNGPSKYGGLPGLIMELNDGNTTILCTKVVLNPADEVQIEKPEKGEEVSREEYQEITAKKLQEMRKMYRGSGDRRGRGNNSFDISIGG